MNLQEGLEQKSEEMAKETARAGKKLFAFIIEAEADLIKGATNIVTFIPKQILQGLAGDEGEKAHRGKQSIEQLVGSGAKLDNIPLNKAQKGDFEAVARQYSIDYSLKEVKSGEKSQYLIFFKAKDVNVLQAAFKEFSARVFEKEQKKSISQRIKKEREAAREPKNRELKREKSKKREVEL